MGSDAEAPSDAGNAARALLFEAVIPAKAGIQRLGLSAQKKQSHRFPLSRNDGFWPKRQSRIRGSCGRGFSPDTLALAFLSGLKPP